MSKLETAELTAAKAWAQLFKATTKFIGRVDKIFRVPKAPKAMKFWRDVQVAFWTFWSLVVTSFILMPQILKLLRY